MRHSNLSANRLNVRVMFFTLWDNTLHHQKCLVWNKRYLNTTATQLRKFSVNCSILRNFASHKKELGKNWPKTFWLNWLAGEKKKETLITILKWTCKQLTLFWFQHLWMIWTFLVFYSSQPFCVFVCLFLFLDLMYIPNQFNWVNAFNCLAKIWWWHFKKKKERKKINSLLKICCKFENKNLVSM